MARFRRLFRFPWRTSFQIDDDIDAELSFHLDMRTAELVETGLDPTTARAEARRQFGDVRGATHYCHALDEGVERRARWSQFVDDLRRDFVYAFRMLVTHRSFTAVAVLALAVGIGISNAMLTVYIATCVRGLPITEADRVAWLSTSDARARGAGLSLLDFEDTRAAVGSYEAMAAFTSGAVVVGDAEQPPGRFQGAHTSVETFQLIGETPDLGRDFLPEDGRPDAPPTVILGGGVWRSRYAADPDILGRSISVGGRPATVIGVMRDRLRFPANADLWQPLAQLTELREQPRDSRTLGVIGRLRDGVTMGQARTEADTIAARLAGLHQGTNKGVRFRTEPINNRFNNADATWRAFVRVGFVVLLIVCANVANLLLMRAVSRTREMAVRASLGAGRWRVIRQLLTESALLSMLGGAAGLLMSVILIRVFESGLPEGGKPYWAEYTIDTNGFALLLSICLGSVFVFGLVPAIIGSRADGRTMLEGSGRSDTRGRSARRWTGFLQTVQIAFAVVFCAAVAGGVASLASCNWHRASSTQRTC